jgi:hypothetical protein
MCKRILLDYLRGGPINCSAFEVYKGPQVPWVASEEEEEEGTAQPVQQVRKVGQCVHVRA